MKPAPAISAVVGALTLLTVGVRLGLDPIALARLAVLGAALGVIVRDDLRAHRIPNRVVLPAMIACATLSLIGGLHASGLIGGGALLTLLFAAALARPAWIGMGDVKLALLMLCGLHSATPRALLFAVELAAAIAVLLALRHRRLALRVALPMAPFMAAGCVLALLI
jgi:leader peptidase (prepilin peptidase) / N-methyltransferase